VGTADTARRVMELLGQGRLDDLIPMSHPEVEWHSFFAELGEGGVYRGLEGMRHYIRDLREAWELVRADVDDTVEVGDVAVLVGRIHFQGKGSGLEMEMPAGWMLKFRDGKVVLFRAFREPEAALEAVGVTERPGPRS
jgi:ketosteroid isomerase-like protein